MKLDVSYKHYKLSSTITVPISIRDIILNVKQSLKISDINVNVIDESNEIIPESEIILPEKSSNKILYLVDKPKAIIKGQKPFEKTQSIEEIIMQVTGASEKIVVKKPQITNSLDIFEQLSGGDSNLSRLISLLQNLEEQNIDIRVRQNNPPQNVEPNENYVRELKDMGFPEDRARDALMRTGNDINRATDILLNGDDEDNNNNHNDEEDQNEEPDADI